MIDNTEDMIDSREVNERIAELEAEAVSRYAAGREHLSYGELAEAQQGGALDDDERAELAALRALADEGANASPDWEYGATLIRDSYFKEYAQELAEDLGAIRCGAGWPLYCIDWERAARELRMDYTSVDFNGVTYWVR